MISKKIRYFMTLAECLSFTKAANEYGVSQTAISQYIAGLEQRLGVKLFDRNPHSVSLTEAGKVYYRRVCHIMQYYEDTVSQNLSASELYSGYVKVGIGIYEYHITDDFFSLLLHRYPDIKADVYQYPYEELTRRLKNGELDMIVAIDLCRDSFANREIRTQKLFESRNCIVVDKELATKYPEGDAAEMLKNEYLITNCENGGPSSMDMLRNLLVQEFGFFPEKTTRTNNINPQLLMVRSKQGVAIVPDFIKEIYDPDFVRIPMKTSPNYQYELMSLEENDNPVIDIIMNLAKEM
ncbi:MAG: LysR family transcriptional regulator [Firmicutes bacterium]|nr:LysR family transcriptional regulator [Bacillota bacterium]